MARVDKPQRAVYFDCYSGISGDMVLGALVDLGVDLKKIRAGLKSLGLSKGYEIKSRVVQRGLISGTKVDVVLKPVKRSHGRHFSTIKNLIEKSELPEKVKSNAIEIFHRIAKSEAKVHHTSIEKVHFHEVGAVDSIVDIVGGALAMELLNVERVFSSPLNVGEGFVECEHGTLPVPAPATLNLLEGIPCFSSGIKKELTTPTGAGMIGFFAEKFQSLPKMKIIKTGYGAGDHVIENSPNMLRIILGELEGRGESECMTIVETNIDDMNPEFYDHLMDMLFKAGAVDVFFTPVSMKKNRPAVKLSVMVLSEKRERISKIILSETSTFGVRYFEVNRTTLDREIQTVKTPFGPVKVKVGSLDGSLLKISPEYEDCKKIARKEKLPIKKVYEEVLRLAHSQLK
jgi:pyridinium-3,5-bisthiocarboxylic acid mononucleotide nickel chelatase